MNREAIDHYAAGGEKLSLAIRGLTPQDMICMPTDPNVGKWSIQQVVVHLLDSDLINSDRMKRIIAEDNPTLIGYDETKLASNLHYDKQPVADALTIFELNRKLFTIILRQLPDSAFDRVGTHNESGKMTLAQWLERTNKHLDHHLNFIHAKRAKMGKEMW
jgi:hypothetical protein